MLALNRDVDARAVLAPAVEGFTPTSEFSEIEEARALLGILAQTGDVKAAAALQQQRVQLQISLGNALMAARGYAAPETTAAFARVREVAGGIADAGKRLAAYYGIFTGQHVRGEYAAMRETAQAFLREAAEQPHSGELGVALRKYRSNGRRL